MRSPWLVLAALFASAVAQTGKICVPESVLDACHKMAEAGKQAGYNVECVPARDRLECITKVRNNEADFQAVEPEDMYIGAQLDDSAFNVFKEIRTKEESEAEFRYEAVAVIHKDLNIKNVRGLKGLKSCHTGVGRNVGYKIPITKLTKMGILGPLSDTSLSPRENELKALSKFFSKSCLVGTWSPHPDTNTKWKGTYSNLCELCENPDRCDYPDANSGYEGALRCLATAGGSIAFTKVIFVKKFFGLPYGNQPAKSSEFNPEDFAYLCPDGSKRPVTGPACTWAARPWPGYMASSQLDEAAIKNLREKISALNKIGEKSQPNWLNDVLLINNKSLAVDNTPVSPLRYLENAKYKDVIERDVLEPRRVVRICTRTKSEMDKCELLQKAAYSRDIRPSLACVQSDNCVHSVHNKEAEVVVLDPHEAIKAEKHGLKPILNEAYIKGIKQYIVAVVLKGSSVGSIQSLKGKKACFPPNNSAGFFGVIKYLLNNNLIAKTHCPYEKTLTEFFKSIETSTDPIKCLVEGKGDVAFVPESSMHEDKNKKIQLMCPNGSKLPVDNMNCGLVAIPPKLVMTCKELSDVQIDEARQSLLSASNLYSEKPELFRLFGKFDGNLPNVLFSDHALGLNAIKDVLPSYEEYKKFVVDLASCNIN